MSEPEPTPSRCRAAYGGSFDPLTNGHRYIIEQVARTCDVVVVVATNRKKHPMFTPEERAAIIRVAVADLPNVTAAILPPDEYLARYARDVLGAHFLIRGMRNGSDLEGERAMQNRNRTKFGMETMFFMGPSELLDISSSEVKGQIGLNGWEDTIRTDVPPATLDALRKKVTQ